MATSKGKKIQLFKAITLIYKCGCRHDFPKINILAIDREREFANKVRCKDCM